MKKISIAYVSPKYPPILGGSEISLSRIVRGISSNKNFDAKVFTNKLDFRGNILAGGLSKKGGVYRLGSKSKSISIHSKDWYSQVIENAKTLLMQYKDEIDIIYLNKDDYIRNRKDLEWFARLGKPIIVKMIFDKSVFELKPNIASLKGLANQNLLRIHCLTAQTVNDCIKIGFNKEHCLHIPNPVMTDEFRATQKDRLSARHRLGIDPKALVYIYTGRLSPQKNVEGLVDLYTKIRLIQPESQLLIVGDCNYPAYKPVVEKLRKQHPEVRWMKKVASKNVKYYLWASDCFVLASHYEGLSNSLLEAMSAGLCPVVERNISGVRDVIVDRRGGLFYEWGNLPGFLKKLAQTDKKSLRRYGKNAALNIDKKCDIDAVLVRHGKVYKDLKTLDNTGSGVL